MLECEEENPLTKMDQWIEKEKTLGSGNPDRIVLATTSQNNIPHSRVVAIREITSEGIVFFTQQRTKKVNELLQNPHASMTLWLAQQQRQVVLDGFVKALTEPENREYWNKLPRERKLRFHTYAPLSGQPIQSLSILDDELVKLEKKFANNEIPLSPCYCGFRFIARSICFYTLGSDKFSEVLQYEQGEKKWCRQLLSP